MPTALNMTEAQRRRYVESAVRRRKCAMPRQQQERRQALVQTAGEAALLLKTQFGARRVVLFGSLAHRAWFSHDSDIDLAVEGITPTEYWRAWNDVENLFPEIKVDLVELETCSGSLRKAVERTGVEL